MKLAAEAVPRRHTGAQAVATVTCDWIDYSGKRCCGAHVYVTHLSFTANKFFSLFLFSKL